MGTRNFDLGARDMKAAGRIALERGMRSFASIDVMASRWDRFVKYIREHHAIGRMETITPEVVIAYGAWLADQVEDGYLKPATAQNYVSAVNRWRCIRDPRLRIMIRLQRAFGLRFEESAKFDARGVLESLRAKVLWVVEGTKGGRKRQIPICMGAQEDTLHKARDVQGNGRSMIPEDMPYAEFRRDCYRIAARHGIRFHRERHPYAYLRYKRLPGADCPVVAGVPHGEAHIVWPAQELKISEEAARAKYHAIRLQIAQELGHNRIEVTNAYLG